MESLKDRVQRVVQENVEIVSYNPLWPEMFRQEKERLLHLLPIELLGRIEHFGSTAIPCMSAKPIIDILVEVTSLDETKKRIVPILEAEGYEYFWRPTLGDDVPPFYAWFIKRNRNGIRTHHIHMVEKDYEHWDRLFFRDYLIEYPQCAQKYCALKTRLAREYPNDRVAYTRNKTDMIVEITEIAKKYYDRENKHLCIKNGDEIE